MRATLVHLKDMTTDEEQFFAELGTGGVDLEAVLNIGKKRAFSGGWLSRTRAVKHHLKVSEISMNYLKTKLPYLNK